MEELFELLYDVYEMVQTLNGNNIKNEYYEI